MRGQSKVRQMNKQKILLHAELEQFYIREFPFLFAVAKELVDDRYSHGWSHATATFQPQPAAHFPV
jgi:hypothetical protein